MSLSGVPILSVIAVMAVDSRCGMPSAVTRRHFPLPATPLTD